MAEVPLDGLPAWVSTLDMAEEWHIPPWEVERDGSVLWEKRWGIWRRAKSRAMHQKLKYGNGR